MASFLRTPRAIRNSALGGQFSSLSESGFIPTYEIPHDSQRTAEEVLISFREWLHSYEKSQDSSKLEVQICSHLFQRVASFLQQSKQKVVPEVEIMFSSLSESGFIPTIVKLIHGVFDRLGVLISFREWLHSYLLIMNSQTRKWLPKFSSLSESGFIPTKVVPEE